MKQEKRIALPVAHNSGFLPTEDLSGNQITILWPKGAPDSLDQPRARAEIELIRQFVTRFNAGEKVWFSFATRAPMVVSGAGVPTRTHANI